MKDGLEQKTPTAHPQEQGADEHSKTLPHGTPATVPPLEVGNFKGLPCEVRATIT